MSGERNVLDELAALDPTTQTLFQSPVCGWARAHIGIIGWVVLPSSSALGIERAWNDLVDFAYGELDKIPAAVLPVEDLWNAALFLEVPWRRRDPTTPAAVHTTVGTLTHDVHGTRKIALWADQPLSEHLGPLGKTNDSAGESALGDPLGDFARSTARDSQERDALMLLFKRKLTDNEVDHLVVVLGRAATS
jgi:hypothetical protein